jgi:hypothetical protein
VRGSGLAGYCDQEPIRILMKRLHIYLPLAAGALTPLLVILVLENFVGRASRFKPVMNILEFRDAQAIFYATLFAMIPFVALVVLVKAISSHTSGPYLVQHSD